MKFFLEEYLIAILIIGGICFFANYYFNGEANLKKKNTMQQTI